MKRSKRLLVVLMALVLILSACGSSGSDAEGKIIRTNNGSEPGSLDPAMATGTHESWVLQHTFQGLMDYDKEGNLTEGVAESYTVSEDGLKYVFTLKDGIKWSNGDPVVAGDFEYAWKRLLDPDLGADYAFQLYYVKGGEAYNSGEASADDVMVKAKDEKTLEVELEKPTPYFIDLTAFYSMYPVNQKVVEANPDWAKDASTHVSNGAFKLEKWEHNSIISLRKNPEFQYADQVQIAGIDLDIIEEASTAYAKYEGGEYDMLQDIPPEVAADLIAKKDPDLVESEDVGTYYYNLNSVVSPLDNVKVRNALSMSMDRQQITEKITKRGEIPAEGIVPYGLMDENDKDFRESSGNHIEYNPEKAKELMAEGLKEEGKTIEEMQFQLMYNTDENHKKIAEAIQEMWKKNLGVDIALTNLEFKDKLEKEKAGDYQISRAGWIGDYEDPMTMLDLFITDGPFNDTGYSNAEYDKLIDDAKNSADQKVRMDAMRKAEDILMKDMPIVPVYHYTKNYLVKPNIKGVYKTLLFAPTLTYAEVVED